jgi:glutamate synthase (NADPH/NADH) large chain
MVDLEPIIAEEKLMEKVYHQTSDLAAHGRVDLLNDMTRFDAERLHHLITNHLRYTGSTRARDILDDWENYKLKFVKVMPVEYRRALNEMNARRAQSPMQKAVGDK